MDDLDKWATLLGSVAEASGDQPSQICALCVSMLEISGAGISLVTGPDRSAVVCATDERAATIEEVQLTAGVGPGVDAISTGEPVLVPDLHQLGDARRAAWAAFTEAVTQVGVAAIFSFPLRIGAVTLGSLDLHSVASGQLSLEELSAAVMAADVAATAVLHLSTDGDGAFASDGETRSDYRLEVHQATGMIAAQLNVPLETALLRLRARAFATGRTVSDLAHDVVERRLRFTPEDQ